MLGKIYTKAILAELKESLDRPSTSQETGFTLGLAKAMEIINAIDKHEEDQFMERLLEATRNINDNSF